MLNPPRDLCDDEDTLVKHGRDIAITEIGEPVTKCTGTNPVDNINLDDGDNDDEDTRAEVARKDAITEITQQIGKFVSLNTVNDGGGLETGTEILL